MSKHFGSWYWRTWHWACRAFTRQWTPPSAPGVEYALPANRCHYVLPACSIDYALSTNRCHHVLPENSCDYTLPVNRPHYTLPEED